MTPAQAIKKYAKKSHISVKSMEAHMGWSTDTIRKMTLTTEKSIARIKELASVYIDLYDKVPEARGIVGEDMREKVRDARVQGLEALVAQQKETIESLKEQIELLNELLSKYKEQ